MELGPQKTIPILVLGTQFHNGSVCGTLWVSGLTTVATCYHYYCCSNRDYGKDVAGYGTEVKLSVVILSFSMKLLFLWSWSLSLSLSYIYIYNVMVSRPGGDQAISKLERLGYPRLPGSTYLCRGGGGRAPYIDLWNIMTPPQRVPCYLFERKC